MKLAIFVYRDAINAKQLSIYRDRKNKRVPHMHAEPLLYKQFMNGITAVCAVHFCHMLGGRKLNAHIHYNACSGVHIKCSKQVEKETHILA
jgi:hypothetical protein